MSEKKIALLLSGNLRTFFYKDNHICKKYLELMEKQDIDLFIYTDNNDFNYDNIQYFSDKNKNKILGVPNDIEKRLSENIDFINYNDSCQIIKNNLIKIFGNKLKKYHIEEFKQNLIDDIYDKDNIYHNTFIQYKHHSICWKIAIMCQYYKLYKCYNLMRDYEKENNFEYDIIIRSRPELILTNINNIDIRSLNFNKKVYCYQYDKYISDVWCIGDRFIMDKYCTNYINISPNLVEGTYCFKAKKGGIIIVKSKNDTSFWNENISEVLYDISPGGEFACTYIIKKFGYEICHTPLNEIGFKFYDSVFFKYFIDK